MSGALRSRVAGASRDDPLDEDASVVLSTEQQEAVVADLEATAGRAASAWRVAVGVLAVTGGAYFAMLAARAAWSGDVDVWRGVVHIEFYARPEPAISPARLARLDALTALALILGGIAAAFPAKSTRGVDVDARWTSPAAAHRARVAAFVLAALAGAVAAHGWYDALTRAAALARASFPTRMLWLPLAPIAAPIACAHVYASLEGTVVQARALRAHMYQHKRA